MKTSLKNLFLLPALISVLSLIRLGGLMAQTYTTLHSFTAMELFTNSEGEVTNELNTDGASPEASLVLSSNILYGTTSIGGNGSAGTIFAINTNGAGFTNLHSFIYTNGGNPQAALIISENILYGTAQYGGVNWGTVFKVNTDGSHFTNLHSFTALSAPGIPRGTNSDGAAPVAALVLAGTNLYGTTPYGGASAVGTVFKVNTDDASFTNLYSFPGPIGFAYDVVNSYGANPQAALTISGNILYGTAQLGGTSGQGTVFAINTDGTGFTNLHSFNGANDGAQPHAVLVLSGNTLYGTTPVGGIWSAGTVFAINTDGTGFTNLYNFTGSSDGLEPNGSLVLSGATLYGTAQYGGNLGQGTVFAINLNGNGFANLYSFTASYTNSLGVYTNSDGTNPNAGLVLAGYTLYGTAQRGGSSGNGAVFSLSLPAPLQLAITRSGPDVILTWPTNASGVTLESGTNLVSQAFWSANSPAPVVVNGQFIVTNPISGQARFYRLTQ